MQTHRYFDRIREALDEIEKHQSQTIRQAAGLMVEAIVSNHGLFTFGASHSFMISQELVYRTGGLILINPIYPHGMNFAVHPLPATSRMERVPGFGAALLDASPASPGDVLLITSTSGRNAVVIDMALRAREKGIKVVGITSMAYTEGVTSRHSSGKKLADLCDLTIDNAAPFGDASVEVSGFKQKVGPLSSVTGCAIANALVAEIVEALIARDILPPVFMSANLDGGDEYNRSQLEANRSRIHYM